MYTPKKAYFYGTGRRKSSIARVRLIPGGTGVITINNRTLDNYFGMETLKYIVKQPIETVGVAGKFDVAICGITVTDARGYHANTNAYFTDELFEEA